jgi:hypothetical protein
MDRTDATERNWRRQTASAAPDSDQTCFAEACDIDEVRGAFPCLGTRNAFWSAPECNDGPSCVIESRAFGESSHRDGGKDDGTGDCTVLCSKAWGSKLWCRCNAPPHSSQGMTVNAMPAKDPIGYRRQGWRVSPSSGLKKRFQAPSNKFDMAARNWREAARVGGKSNGCDVRCGRVKAWNAHGASAPSRRNTSSSGTMPSGKFGPKPQT